MVAADELQPSRKGMFSDVAQLIDKYTDSQGHIDHSTNQTATAGHCQI